MAISTRQVGFKNIELTMTALPLLPYLQLDGFAGDGIQWERPQPASTRLGADGKGTVNSRPVLYAGTITLLPTSNAREALDNLINHTTGKKTVYSGGIITEFDAGNSANLDDGQADKTYRLEFMDRIILPL